MNPLHLDADYARHSQFGRVVVYGMAAVLYGLGAWAKGRGFKVHQLSSKPVFGCSGAVEVRVVGVLF